MYLKLLSDITKYIVLFMITMLTLTFSSKLALAKLYTKDDILGLVRQNKGKVVILSTSASWCPACRAEVPELNELQKVFKDKIQIIGVAVDSSDLEMNKFKDETNAQYPFYRVGEAGARAFGVQAIPHLFIYNEEGVLYADPIGVQSVETLSRIVKRGMTP